MSYPDHSDEDQQRSRELLVLAAGGGVLCECLGPRPDAEKTHSGEVSARGEFDSLTLCSTVNSTVHPNDCCILHACNPNTFLLLHSCDFFSQVRTTF